MNKTIDKERIKSIKNGIAERKRKEREIYQLQGIDKLKYEIGCHENIIRNCDFDLNGQFKNNSGIMMKKKISEDKLKVLKNKLQEYKDLK